MGLGGGTVLFWCFPLPLEDFFPFFPWYFSVDCWIQIFWIICLVISSGLFVHLSLFFLFHFGSPLPHAIVEVEGCWYVAVDTLSILGSLFSSSLITMCSLGLGTGVLHTSMMLP